MQVANGSHNSLLKVIETCICLLVLCSQFPPQSCLHLGASVSGRHTGSCHAHIVLKNQEAVNDISLFTVRPSSWMQQVLFHSKKGPCYLARSVAVIQQWLIAAWSSSVWLRNCSCFQPPEGRVLPHITLYPVLIPERTAHMSDFCAWLVQTRSWRCALR